MFNKLYFCNNYHNGDLHLSREFVKDIMNKIEAKEYFYSYNPSLARKEVIKDIDVIPIHYVNGVHPHHENYKIIGDDLYINTWVGLKNNQYIYEVNKGCSLDTNYKIYTDTYRSLDIFLEEKEFYIPEIDFDKVEKRNVNDFLYKHDGKNKILISNGKVNSGQSFPFDMNGVISLLSSEFKDYVFILTDSNNRIDKDNIFYTDDIIKIDGSDLLEISYLSRYCQIIIGRGSGPYIFSQIKDNIDKHFVGIVNSCYINNPFWYDFKNRLYLSTENDQYGGPRTPGSTLIYADTNIIFNEIKNYIYNI